MNDDMILDMDNFDFSMIDGLVEESVETEVEEVETEEVETETEEVEESEEESEESEEEAEEQEVETDGEDAEEIDEVDYEGYEITLPSGESVILSDVVNGYKAAEALKAEREEFEAVKTDFEEKSVHVGKMLQLAKLEAERVIEDYKDFDWVSLSKEDPAAYADNREFLDRYKERYEEIHEAVEALEKEKAEAEKKEYETKAREAVAVLTRDVPGWGPDLYKSLMEFAVENGASMEDMKSCVDPVTFKILHKAMQFEKGKQTVKAKVKKIGSPKKVVKAAPAKPKTAPKVNKEALMLKAQEAGDTAAMFALLED